ncbi:cupredoxin domain-containing protein [Kitasatospora purpeofusca]|uniref:cupredoxin domain-containing protein n=1 Tax=Kitasatospora purpeofusca TaxID=67352 RepID=UPI00386EAA6C|nr:cupredoxin domain-containing protein [Kitasatospora purpeofusca]
MNRRSSRPFRSFRTALVGLAAGGLLLGAAGCSSGGGGGGSSSPAVHSPAVHSPAASSPAASSAPTGAVTVTIKNFKFGPATITVAPGTTITVTNQDSAGHTLTAIAPNAGAFDTGLLEQGKSATITAPTTPGSYPFHCDVHPTMTGTLVVQ